MNLRRLALTVALAVIASACGATTSSGSSTQSTYARGPAHVAAFAFDAQQRLWFATAAYTDDRDDGVYVVDKQGATPVEVIAHLHTPLGLLWHDGELYVASKGGVVAYSRLRANRFAARRTVVTLPDNVGELNNLVLGPNGRLLLGISSPCDHCTPANKYSAAIISFTTTGKDVRTYATRIRAPVGLAFVPGTSELLVTMNQRDDLGALTPGDWLAEVAQGTDWRSPECYGQGGAACAGVPQPLAVLDKHAAVAGIAINGATVYVAEWASGKVLRVTLSKSGASSATPFVTNIKNPVALALTPDGALLAGDWSSGTITRIAL